MYGLILLEADIVGGSGSFGQNVSTIEVTFAANAANGNPYFKISNLLFVGLLKFH